MENSVNVIGPILSDRELYEALDTEKFPKLSECITLLDAGDEKGARAVFASVARSVLNRDKFFSLRGRDPKPEFTNGIKATAERALRHEMSSCGTPMKFEGKVDWFANPTFNQYKEWTWQLSRHNELIHLAKAYRATGDQRYADGCAELLDSWIKQAVRPDLGVGSYATLCWRTIECGIRMGLMWPEIIHTFYDNPAFNDDLIVDFYKSVYEHSVRMINAFTTGNWLMHELNGLAQNGVFYPFFKDAAYWVELSMDKIDKEISENQVYPDGFQFENSTGYHGVVITHTMEIVEIAMEYGVPVSEKVMVGIENMLMLYVRLMQSNRKMPHPNDGGGAACDALLRKYARYYRKNPYFKWLLTDGAEGKKPEFGSILLENCGMIALRREDWGKDTSAFFDAGVFGKGHQHEDKLNLTICNSEKPVLCEANTYAYDTSDERKYCLASEGHNVVLVNGMGQNRRAGYQWLPEDIFKKAENATLTVTPEMDVATGIYDEGYGADKAKITTHKRTVIMLKQPKAGLPVYVAIDEMTSEIENEYEAIWHYDTTNAAVNCGVFVSDEATQFICGDLGETEVVCGRKEPYLQGWICRSTIQGNIHPIPTLLHRVKGKNIRTVNVITVHGEEGSAVVSVSLTDDVLTINYKNGDADTVAIG